jgi:predicted amidohydrolase
LNRESSFVQDWRNTYRRGWVDFLSFVIHLRGENDDILIRNGEVVDPGGNFQAVEMLDSGKIIKPGGEETEDAETVIDAKGCLVLPGLIDFHAHVFLDNRDGSTCRYYPLAPGNYDNVDGGVPFCKL